MTSSLLPLAGVRSIQHGLTCTAASGSSPHYSCLHHATGAVTLMWAGHIIRVKKDRKCRARHRKTAFRIKLQKSNSDRKQAKRRTYPSTHMVGIESSGQELCCGSAPFSSPQALNDVTRSRGSTWIKSCSVSPCHCSPLVVWCAGFHRVRAVSNCTQEVTSFFNCRQQDTAF